LASLRASSTVGDLEHPVDVVFDEQHGNLGGDGRQQRGDACALRGGEPGERLVEQQYSRPRRNGEPHVEQALAAIGERGCFRLFDAAEAEKGDKVRSLFVHLRHRRGRGPQCETLGAARLHGEPQVLLGRESAEQICDLE